MLFADNIVPIDETRDGINNKLNNVDMPQSREVLDYADRKLNIIQKQGDIGKHINPRMKVEWYNGRMLQKYVVIRRFLYD